MASSSTSRLGSSIGAGSFGAVHLAVDPSTGLLFAVKSVSLTSSSPASIHSLENEIKILASLSSPYIVSYLGHETAGDRRNLHLEYMPGGSVADATSKGRPLDEPRVRAFARCVARALLYLHDVAGVVHCDVKGRNVLLRRDRRAAKLADFGAAVRLSDAPPGARGTPLWMAPEVARGEPPTPAADVWSLGCTVIEMATGTRPWGNLASKDAAGALLEIAYGDGAPELPGRLSDAGRDFLDKCLRRDARERWTAEQLLRHPFLSEEEGEVAEPSPRGVLECTEVESDDDGEDSDGEEGWEAAARERVKELGSGGGAFDWRGDEGWEVVRSSEEEKLMAEMEEEKEEEMGMDGIGCSASCRRCRGWWCCEEQKIELIVLLLIKYIIQLRGIISSAILVVQCQQARHGPILHFDTILNFRSLIIIYKPPAIYRALICVLQINTSTTDEELTGHNGSAYILHRDEPLWYMVNIRYDLINRIFNGPCSSQNDVLINLITIITLVTCLA